jgi:peptidoglycan hydrolase-like protein with peptidoglycan-binding domain
MRGVFGAVLSGVLAAAVAGCNVLELQYFREGIGSELYVSDAIDATQIQDAYVGLICRQAGLETVLNADGTYTCEGSSNWSLFVQAGMNDIDRRCDAYLLWLDDKRRSNEPFLKELAAVSAATLGIMDAASASVKAITIAGIAFGLAANTFTNVNSRLLALEQSTVQSVVLDTQQRYRKNNSPLAVTSRPMAIYYLRNYLRICLPFSIETSVNNTVTVFHRAGADALDRDNSLFTKQIIITDPRRGLTPPKPRPSDPEAGRASEPEIIEFQQALCVSTADGKLGSSGSETRRAILGYLSALNRRPVATFSMDAGTITQLQRAVAEVGECQRFQFASGFEVGALGVPATLREKKIKELQTKLRDNGAAAVKVTGTFDADTRAAIEKIRVAQGIVSTGSAGTLNFPLYQAILKLKKTQ